MVQGQTTKLLLFSILVIFGGGDTQALYLKIISLATAHKSATNLLITFIELLFQNLLVTHPYLNFTDYNKNVQGEFKKMHKDQHISFKPSPKGGHLRWLAHRKLMQKYSCFTWYIFFTETVGLFKAIWKLVKIWMFKPNFKVVIWETKKRLEVAN